MIKVTQFQGVSRRSSFTKKRYCTASFCHLKPKLLIQNRYSSNPTNPRSKDQSIKFSQMQLRSWGFRRTQVFEVLETFFGKFLYLHRRKNWTDLMFFDLMCTLACYSYMDSIIILLAALVYKWLIGLNFPKALFHIYLPSAQWY